MQQRSWLVFVLLCAQSACQHRADPPPAAPPAPAPAPVVSASASAVVPVGPKPELGNAGIDLSHRQISVKPGDDFYRHVNGAWLDTYQLKPDEMQYGAFVALRYRSEDRVKAIVTDVSQNGGKPGSVEQQIGDYFKSYMDSGALETKGITALKSELAAIAGIRNRQQLIQAFGRAELTGTDAPITSGVEVDRRDSNRYMLNVYHAGLGLPDRSYYLEDTFKHILASYEQHIATMLGFTGLAAADAKRDAASIVKLETEIAKLHWTRTELRDMDKTNNVYTLKAFETAFPGYPWRTHFKAGGLDLATVKELNVYTPNALEPLAKLVGSTPLPVWKAYLTYHLVSNAAPLLGNTIDNTNFEFQGKVLSGQAEQRDRWKRGVTLIGDAHALGEAIGKLYVERYFPPESMTQMSELVGNLRAALKERIDGLTWMTPVTKEQALAKLGTFNPKIGYPKKWRDFSSIAIAPDNLMSNFRAVKKYWYDDELSRLPKATNRDEWQMTPQTINAYYDSSFNEIVFPAAILQPPFFDPNADAAVNYGGIGAVIGHEMGHGFDDQGSKSDAYGVQRNWWTDQDRAKFEATTGLLVKQFSAFEPLKGQKLNGALTLGENIGDLGGLSMAYHAYQKHLAGKAAPVIDGLTGEQRFFMAWAQVWATKERDEVRLRNLKANPHSPGEFRVNGVVRNISAWYDAFGVKPGDALYLAPNERVTVW